MLLKTMKGKQVGSSYILFDININGTLFFGISTHVLICLAWINM